MHYRWTRLHTVPLLCGRSTEDLEEEEGSGERQNSSGGFSVREK